jgi:hypothetical protein
VQDVEAKHDEALVQALTAIYSLLVVLWLNTMALD